MKMNLKLGTPTLRWRQGPWVLLLLLLGQSDVFAGTGNTIESENLEFFESKVRPLLVERCYECHSQEKGKTKGDLALDSKSGVEKGGENGPIAIPGKPDKSRLMEAVTWTNADLKMPPKKQLAKEEIEIIKKWIAMGLPDPRKEVQISSLKPSTPLWSLKPIQNPVPPKVSQPVWSTHPVDRFLAAKWEEEKLQPAEVADKQVLLRRATFDLTGLPPTREELKQFLSDPSTNAFEKVVDKLLATQQYGEKWARHWFDLVRYADTSGCNSDFPIPSAYKYRNYVIHSFMEDKPYDQFIREQISGDLLTSTNEAERNMHIIATGYLALSRRFGSRAAEFHQTLEDTIDNLGKTFMGLSLGCARCHDHKFDPVSARDYYALYGIFESTRFAFPGTEVYRHPKDFVPLASSSEAKELLDWQSNLSSLDDQIEELTKELKPLRAAFEKQKKLANSNVDDLPVAKLHSVNQSATNRTYETVRLEMAELKEKLATLEHRPPRVEKAYAVSEGTSKNTRIQKKGEPSLAGEEVPRGFLSALGGQELPHDCKESGRRQLAEWVADKKNPLTARVMVNRIWQFHFGKGIVQSPNDFGFRGTSPTHPELLDFLASKFVNEGWSIKSMHKFLMLCRAYQMSSTPKEATGSLDVNNDYLSRFNTRRMEAEEIRDSMLMLSGCLDTGMGGEFPFPPESEWRFSQHAPFVADYPSAKRSIYLLQERIRRNPLLESFDAADANAATGERPLTTTPLQALFMMNSRFVQENADQFGTRIALAHPEEGEQINDAYERAFSRPASREEIASGKKYLREAREELEKAGIPSYQLDLRARESYLRVLLSSNEFLFIE